MQVIQQQQQQSQNQLKFQMEQQLQKDARMFEMMMQNQQQFMEQQKQQQDVMRQTNTLKVFCTVAANEKWTIEGSDVRAAFFQADKMERDIFIEPPPERKKPGFIWKLLKLCYGLKDASRQWFNSLSKYLTYLGTKRSRTDSCLFYFHEKCKLKGLLLVHVDDILSCGNQMFKKMS